MSTRKEGAGLRAPPRNSARAKILAVFTGNPGHKLPRREILEQFGLSESAIENALHSLRKEGCIRSVRLPDGSVHYELITLIGIKVPRLHKTKRPPKPIRAWPESRYVEPKPVAISVFHLAETL
jgi:DNA-binding Lrp family transcriptional regulator